MIGYKGFDKNFRCRNMQYEVGKTYHHDGELIICKSGLHFCEKPLAVLEHYPPVDGNRYAQVEVTGRIIVDKNKSCTDELTVVKELSLTELIAAAPDENKSTATGNYSAATNTGYRSAATNTGYCSAATNTGYCSAAVTTGNRSAAVTTGNCSAAVTTGNWSAAMVTGENSVAMVIGEDSRAKAALGCWIVLSEWRDDQLADVQVFRVDGEHIKPDTFYQLKDGVPVEADD